MFRFLGKPFAAGVFALVRSTLNGSVTSSTFDLFNHEPGRLVVTPDQALNADGPQSAEILGHGSCGVDVRCAEAARCSVVVVGNRRDERARIFFELEYLVAADSAQGLDSLTGRTELDLIQIVRQSETPINAVVDDHFLTFYVLQKVFGTKLARYSTGLKSFGLTVRNSMQELSMLGLFMVTAIIFFSTIVTFGFVQKNNARFNVYEIRLSMLRTNF